MLLGWLMALFALAWGHEVLGELPPGTTLLSEQAHPEYLRYHLRAEREFYVELTPSRGAGTPVCQGEGVDLWVRTRLDGPESFDWDPLPAVVDQACARLRERPPRFPSRRSVASGRAPDPGEAPRPGLQVPGFAGWRPLQPVGVLWALVFLWALPRGWLPWACGLAALGVRLLAAPRTVLLGGDAAYERLLGALGTWSPNPYYGDGWPALMGLFARVLPGPPDWVHAVNLGASALSVPLAVGLTQALGGGRGAALGAGMVLSLSPWPVRLAAMEDHFVWAGLLVLSGLWGAARRDTAGAWLAALSVGLLVHLRPLYEPFAALVLGLLAWERRWLPAALGAGLVAWRVAELLPLVSEGAGTGVVPWRMYLWPRFWLRLLLPSPFAADLHLHPGVTPLGVTVLGLGGLVGALAQGRLRRAAVLGLGAGALVLPVLPKLHPWADPLRLQLPACGVWAVLAGFGLAELGALGRRAQALGLGLTALSALPIWLWGGWSWAWQEEYTLLQRWAEQIPAGQRVLYDASQDPNGHFGTWLGMRSPGRWAPWNGPQAVTPQEGDWLYRGTADALRQEPGFADRCDLERLREAALSPTTDGWVDLGAAPVPATLARVGVCRGLSPPGAR